jgi:hypothetical protein
VHVTAAHDTWEEAPSATDVQRTVYCGTVSIDGSAAVFNGNFPSTWWRPYRSKHVVHQWCEKNNFKIKIKKNVNFKILVQVCMRECEQEVVMEWSSRETVQLSLITAAARPKAWTVFARSDAGIVGSNPTRAIDVCVRLFCVGSGLATGWSPVQGVLPTVYRLRKWKSGQPPQWL